MLGQLRKVEKVTARVFCQLSGGGNPVTIFNSSAGCLSEATQQRLAKSCDWESVMVSRSRSIGGNDSSAFSDNEMAFYMPTGEQVSFCAHAAMGGAFDLLNPRTRNGESSDYPFVNFVSSHSEDNTNYRSELHEGDIIALEMKNVTWQEGQVPHKPTFHRIVRECFRLSSSDLTEKINPAGPVAPHPTFLNSSIARPKTLLYVNSEEALHRVKAPSVDNDNFRNACDAVESTGIYLYARKDGDDKDNHSNDTADAFECRQFPRASGYPEDPATGIAAAALAVSLHHRRLEGEGQSFASSSHRSAEEEHGLQNSPGASHICGSYKFHQGTAMGQPSLIMVEDIRFNQSSSAIAECDINNNRQSSQAMGCSFRLLGRVEVDKRETLSIPLEE